MNEARAQLKSYRQSPRKARLLVDVVRGKKVSDALTILSFIPKRAALPIQKLLASALANAKSATPSKPVLAENLIVKDIVVNAGPTLRRRRPRSRGMSNPIKKRTSHITITLVEPKTKSNKLTANL